MSSELSRIKPSQRERKRYVLVHVESDKHIHGLRDELVKAVNDAFGLMKAAKASVVAAKTYPATNHVILRVAHNHCEDLIRAVSDLDEIAGVPATATTHITSGVIKQVKAYYEANR